MPFNEDQRGGHDDAGACYGAVRGPLVRGQPPEDLARTLEWLDRVWAELLRLREENARLREALSWARATLWDAQALAEVRYKRDARLCSPWVELRERAAAVDAVLKETDHARPLPP